MPSRQKSAIQFLLPAESYSRGTGSTNPSATRLPRILGGTTRTASHTRDTFINDHVIDVESTFDLTGISRGGDDDKQATPIEGQRLLSLEAVDGSTLIIRADKLQAELAYLFPREVAKNKGQIDLALLQDNEATARGVSSWIWSSLSVLDLKPDGLVELAKDKALELLKDKLGEEYEDLAYAGASWAGAKALMWAIESRLEGETGLYHWEQTQIQPNQLLSKEDESLQKAAEDGQPILVFIHGLASSTTASFADLRKDKDDHAYWDALTRQFNGHVYGFEHRTLSESPLENALELAKLLPANAKVSFVTQSHGGLIGDLLCSDNISDDMIERFQRKPLIPMREAGDEPVEESEENKRLREVIIQQEQAQLRELRELLAQKSFNIQRYIRVASPASGTTLLSGNLDLFLSSLLSLMSFSARFIPAVGTVSSSVLSAFRRVVLEIADKRIDPQLIPGIESMLPNSPMTVLLAQAKRREGIEMAVIAGNSDGEHGSYLKRIAVMLTDWILFDQQDNDFVVDTQSMRAGLARRNKAYEYYVKGHEVHHLSYFEQSHSRDALKKWLTHSDPSSLSQFSPIRTDAEVKLDETLEASTANRRDSHTNTDDLPIIFYLPGVMGSHLEIRKAAESVGSGDRVWFDPFHLAAGGIDQISIRKQNVRVEGLFRHYYGDLEEFLQRENEVISFPYDWRQSVEKAADLLAKAIKEKLEEIKHQPARQVSILAHSMGGLVVRAMLSKYPKLWDKIALEHDGQFVMLGTPNNGSHAMVENMIGKGSSMRHLAMLDFHHDLQEIIDVVSQFEGVLQLLPHEDFADTGIAAKAPEHQHFCYTNPEHWEMIRSCNRDRWFSFNSDGLGAKISKSMLKRLQVFWGKLHKQNTKAGLPHSDKISYVFGLSGHTPCGLTEHGRQLHLHGTTRGDGTVTWDSGRLGALDDDHYWYIPVPHGSLTNSSEYFDGILELVKTGRSQQLSQIAPRTRSSVRESYTYDAGPMLQPGAEDLALSFFGGRPKRQAVEDTTQVLDVSVQAMDLRFSRHPIMCGHYIADSIAGAEVQIDRHLVGGALSQRERLGVYAGEIGTCTIVLNKEADNERQGGSASGALIVGMGEWSKITVEDLVQTVRDGVLRFLLHNSEQVSQHDAKLCAQTANDASEKDLELSLNSLLLGYNSTTHITVAASIEAIVRGVCEANQQYRHNKGKQQIGCAIRHLSFIEFFMDTAITAAYYVRELPQRLEKELRQMQARIVPEAELQYKAGMRQRLSESGNGNGYWARMIVTSADDESPNSKLKVIPKGSNNDLPQAVRDLLNPTEPAEAQHDYAERIKYVYLSERARAEAIVQQRQPGLIEALIKDAITTTRYDPDLSRTLFQLMVPLDFKVTARQAEKMLLVVDGYTANLPWEMLQADDEPLALKLSMVRQMESTRYRANVVVTNNLHACVIGNPATDGFYTKFITPPPPVPNDTASLASLSGAVQEAQAVTKTLVKGGYDVEQLYPNNSSDQPYHTALDVFKTLFKRPYKILMIAAHGEVNIRGLDGKARTGVVLSEGVMLTAAEVAQMEVVPDLVFLNCCHLAKADNNPEVSYNRLAYSLARELIEMGVRCVIAAGWAVDDLAACTFSKTFFESFVSEEQNFGDAVFEARKQTYQQHMNSNTWGAYQAYGDPNFVLRVDDTKVASDYEWSPVAPQELKQRLENLLVEMQHSDKTEHAYSYNQLVERIDKDLSKVPPAWVNFPGTQYLLARLYGTTLPEGFERARVACERAIFEEDKLGQVPITALELLGNYEARQAEALSDKAEFLLTKINRLVIAKSNESSKAGKAKKAQEIAYLEALKVELFEEANALVENAIKRLKGLIDITHTMPRIGSKSEDTSAVNSERFALLGSALKRKATIMCRQQMEWDQVKLVLKESAEAYESAETVSFDNNFDPYPSINRMQLCGVLGMKIENVTQLADRMTEATHQRFEKSFDFFSAVMIADVEVAKYLLDLESSEKLLATYQQCVSGVPRTKGEFMSVVKQLYLLATFLKTKADSESAKDKKATLAKAKVLTSLGGDLRYE